MLGQNDADKLPPSDVKLNLPVDSQSGRDGGFKEPSPPAPIRRVRICWFHTPDIYLESVRSYRRPGDGERPSEARHTATANNIMWKSTEIRAISVTAWFSLQERRVQGSAASVWGEISATQRQYVHLHRLLHWRMQVYIFQPSTYHCWVLPLSLSKPSKYSSASQGCFLQKKLRYYLSKVRWLTRRAYGKLTSSLLSHRPPWSFLSCKTKM